jgi:hypothetical protein
MSVIISPTVPDLDDDDECVVNGMRTGRGIISIWKNSAPMSLGPHQIPHNLTWD